MLSGKVKQELSNGGKDGNVMAKVIVFNGTPRKNGNTKKLIDQVISGARSVGAEVSFYDLNDSGVRGCQGCYYCRKNEGCSIKDDTLAPMYEDIKNADGIVFGSPVYFYQITGQAKMWMDRMFPMVVGMDMKPRYPGKKFVTIFAQGNPDPNRHGEIMEFVNNIFKGFGWNMTDCIISAGSTNPEYQIPQEQLDQAFEDGKRLVGSL